MSARVTEVDANGLRFEVLLEGDDAAETVILLHGYPQSAGSWGQVMGRLADAGYRAVAPNLRGYSPGANPPDARDYAMDRLCADVLGIAQALGAERFHVVGHDWGGGLAWALAADHPDRLASVTSLSTPHGRAMVRAMRTSGQAARSWYMGFFRLPRVPEAMLGAANFAQTGMSVRMFGLPRDAWWRDRAQLRRAGGMRGPLNWYRGASRGAGHAGRVAVPALYLWGRHDRFLGRRAATLTAEFVDGPYTFVEVDGGHWLPDRNATEVAARLLEHLRAHPVRTSTASVDDAAPAAGAPARPPRRRRASAGAPANEPDPVTPAGPPRRRGASAVAPADEPDRGTPAAADIAGPARKRAGGTSGPRSRSRTTGGQPGAAPDAAPKRASRRPRKETS